MTRRSDMVYRRLYMREPVTGFSNDLLVFTVDSSLVRCNYGSNHIGNSLFQLEFYHLNQRHDRFKI